MRMRTIVLALAGFGAAVAVAWPQQHTGGEPQRFTGELVMTFNGPRGLPTDEEGQPASLPPLPRGVTIQMIQQGDSIFRGAGGCVTCHGVEATGLPNKGSALTTGVHFIPPKFPAIDSLIMVGIPEALTRSTIAMPARGANSNLTPEQVRQVAAYVWAIATTRGEPWPGGHKSHAPVQGSTGGMH
ncbi:MAG: c-type cytochrome [Gemmatimonadetes bacterium]|nr:c-type cytochrome [Gemmatimonadota bacterium]